MNNKKFYGLDLLRGVAGYGVAITHYFYFVQKQLDFEYYSFLFVEIFFILSGFVLSNQLIKVYKERKNISGGWITWYGKTLKNFDTDNSGECEWVPGGNFAVSKKQYFQAGGFDTNFIGTAVMEDGDFGYAVTKSGGKVYYYPEPEIEHLRIPTGGLRQRDPDKGMFYRSHNTVYFFRKHRKRKFLLFVFIYRTSELKKTAVPMSLLGLINSLTLILSFFTFLYVLYLSILSVFKKR